MKTFPRPVVLAAFGGVVALPFSGTASVLLLFTAALGAIISIDYPQRYRGLRLPRRVRASTVVFRPPPLRVERHRLAA